MTDEEILALAEISGMTVSEDDPLLLAMTVPEVNAFARAIEKAVREECARSCEVTRGLYNPETSGYKSADLCAAAIRALKP